MGDLLMHIGHDKTGSSYLQSLFAKKTSPCLGATAFIIQSHAPPAHNPVMLGANQRR